MLGNHKNKKRKAQVKTCTLAEAIRFATQIMQSGLANLNKWVIIGDSVLAGKFKASVLCQATGLDAGDVSNAKTVAKAMAKSATFKSAVKAGKYYSLQSAVEVARPIVKGKAKKKKNVYSASAKKLIASPAFKQLTTREKQNVKKALRA